MTFRELLDNYGLTLCEAASFFDVPYNTVFKWYKGTRACSPFTVSLMDCKLRHEWLLSKYPAANPYTEERFDAKSTPDIRQRLIKLSDEELAEEIRSLSSWDEDLLRELCFRGGTLDDFLLFEDPDCPPIYRAAERLGVYIGIKGGKP